MDAYPPDFIALNRPLVLLSGLEAATDSPHVPLLQDNGALIDSDFPSLHGALAGNLRASFLECDGDSGSSRSADAGFKFRSVGRSYTLPRRKADPPALSPPGSPADEQLEPPPSFVLHSPLSPLTPSSPTFPDGLLSPLWVTKHQTLVPAAVINFFPLSLDSNMSSLRDNQLKIEINGLKREWAASGYKTRFIVVLLAEQDEDGSLADVDDRVAGIRRATNLDQKSIFLLPPDATPAELKEFTNSLLSLLHPSIMEYYRDLSKHARRKRNRSSIPPPTLPPTSGTSQTLSHQGWNVRYEFKLAVFAEFRQEMDAAYRSYQSAYDTLFAGEVFENIPGWNPRFNDARLLADALAIRIIRCLFWAGQTSAAVRSWVNHKNRIQDIVDRRGKGTGNYGWEAWESRWSMVMAQLIRWAEVPALSVDTAHPQNQTHCPIFVPRDRAAPAPDGLFPWDQLHHEGYWLYRSASHTINRRTLAEQIPHEDRVPPGQSPASQIASKLYLYDTYLVPDPHLEAPQQGQGFDHSGLILNTLKESLEEFSKRSQRRKVESLSLQIAEEYMRIGSWSEAHDMLRPLWPNLSWRRAGWWQLMARFGWALRECALRVQDGESVIRIDWELLSRVFQPRIGWHYDIHKSLESLPAERPKPSVVLRAEDTVSSLAASFVFEKPEGNVGEPLQAQLCLSSCAQPSSGPIRLSEVKVVFEGCLRPVKLQSDQNADTDITSAAAITPLTLREPSTSADPSALQSPSSVGPLVGLADLTVGPSQSKVFNLTCIPRESGEARVASITMVIEEEKFDIVHVVTDQAHPESFWWQDTKKGPYRRRVGKDRDTNKCKVMPKPPKIRITTPDLRGTYYTNERIALRIGIHNDEDESADVSAEARLFGRPESTARLLWLDEEDSHETPDNPDSSSEDGSHFLKRSIGSMERSSDKELAVVLSDTQTPSDYELELSGVYNLLSDVHTPIVKTVTVSLSIMRPFEANYEFLPRLHPQPWPDFFQVDDELLGAESSPGGLQQRFCISSKVVSFALEPLEVERMSLVLVGLSGDAVCDIGPKEVTGETKPEISPEELRESNFILNVQKAILGDRRPTALSLALEIRWRRKDANDHPATTTQLPIPRFVVPIGEPRVLASATSSSALLGLIHMDYTLENPSMHFLTFNLTMEASEYFAFSGPKSTVIQLLPMSRHTVRYNLLASKGGLWIQPQLTVVDTYFNKTLRVLPTENMRADKKGVLVWVDADE